MTSQNTRCPGCDSTHTVRRGTRKTKTGPRQMYLCRKCGRHFSLAPLPGFNYPVRAILSAPLRYYTGYTMKQVQRHVAGHYGKTPSLSTVHGWIQRFGVLAGLKNERAAMIRMFPPGKMIFKKRISADRSSDLRIHRYKLETRTGTIPRLKAYLDGLMQEETSLPVDDTAVFASQLERELPVATYRPKGDYALQVASLALKTSWSNYQRHNLVEKFFLVMDGSTIAAEVPLFLTAKEAGSILKFESGLIGHVDLLQVRDDTVYISDYKPDARLEKYAVGQLTAYAVALSARTGIHLKHIRCGWFDERDNFAFPAMDGYKALRKTTSRKI